MMRIATFHPGEWAGLVGVGAGILAGIWRAAAKVSSELKTFRTEHNALVADLKARSEQLERATPGIVPLPESAAVKEAINGG